MRQKQTILKKIIKTSLILKCVREREGERYTTSPNLTKYYSFATISSLGKQKEIPNMQIAVSSSTQVL